MVWGSGKNWWPLDATANLSETDIPDTHAHDGRSVLLLRISNSAFRLFRSAKLWSIYCAFHEFPGTLLYDFEMYRKKKTLRHNENGIRLLHRNHTTYDVRLIQSGTLSLRQPAMLCRCFFFLEHLFPLISVVNVTLEQTQWCSLKIPSVICNVSQASNNTKFLRLPSWHTKNE